MSERLHTTRAKGVTLTVDLWAGHIRTFEIERDGRLLRPLYTAPWVEDPAIADDETILPDLRALSGDFFCAPFNTSDVDTEAPAHGWPANSPWDHVGTEEHPAGGKVVRYALRKQVCGARLVKELTIRDGHPFLYQRHVFEGGSGAVPVASHGMTHFDAGGRLSFSPKAYADLPAQLQETDPARGRSVLKAGAKVTDFSKLPLGDGSFVDLRTYPIAEGHEDFLALVEAPGSALGWTAALRNAEQDVVLSLKSPSDFPITMLWFSNGGRYYAPWNSRNIGVLGIEEGRTYSLQGHKASAAPNPWSEAGIPTALVLNPGGTAEVRHVVGGIPAPAGWSEVASVEVGGGRLTVTDKAGGRAEVPFDDAFLGKR